MTTQKYTVNQYMIDSVVNWVKSGEIAIPEIQRPFVWDSSKVRDLIDSLYQGFPVGYIIAWKNPNVKLKDGSVSEGKKVLIDGQQRVTALQAALTGQPVINQKYQTVKIKIAFNPLEEKFEVLNPAIEKDKTWVNDIAPLMSGEVKVHHLVPKYLELNSDIEADLIYDRIDKLCDIVKKQIGMIELDSELDIETVTEIFIRINSKGVVLSQADFAMSKIAANEEFNGNTLRKAIDYFCHLAKAPEFIAHIENDEAFISTDYFKAMKWLRNENDDLYDPDYSDMLRVAYTSNFDRGRLAFLVSLLSGRNFEARTYEKEIEEASYNTLANGVKEFINETNFKRFLMIIRSTGFVSRSMIRSQNALNFAYILYLKLKRDYGNEPKIEHWVRRWFVMSVLTGRYSGSPESRFEQDIKAISSCDDFTDFLSRVEATELSDAFWDLRLVQNLTTSSTNASAFKVYLAAQAAANEVGFLSSAISVKDMLIHKGDMHHVFPRAYLKKNGFTQAKYNQVANYVFLQQEINIKIADSAPDVYIEQVQTQCDNGDLMYGSIRDKQELDDNFVVNCMPLDNTLYQLENYDDFLIYRRQKMAEKIKEYYFKL
ncbi:TPA: DUF262 domain-containing protein [Vibrio diabolicus]